MNWPPAAASATTPTTCAASTTTATLTKTRLTTTRISTPSSPRRVSLRAWRLWTPVYSPGATPRCSVSRGLQLRPPARCSAWFSSSSDAALEALLPKTSPQGDATTFALGIGDARRAEYRARGPMTLRQRRSRPPVVRFRPAPVAASGKVCRQRRTHPAPEALGGGSHAV